MVADLRYFNSIEHEVDSLKSQLKTQKPQFLNEIDRLSREYYYVDHMNAILGVYTSLDEFTDLQCDYVDQVVKCERLKNELSKRNTTSKSFEALQQQAINLELALQQNLKAQLQDKDIAISELKKLIEKMKGKSMETKLNSRNKMPMAVPISTRDPKRTMNQSAVTPLKRTVALVEITLFIIDFGCSKHMTGNLKFLSNFVEKFLDVDLEVAFRKSTCYIRDLKGNVTGSHGIDLYSITLQDTSTPNPICLMAKATSSQAWLWHRRLSHLNFNTINLFSKYDIVTDLPKLKFIYLDSLLEVERRNRTLVEAARTMLSVAKVPLFCWAEAIAISCFTQNRSLMASDHVSSDPVPQCPTTALEHDILSLGPQSKENVPQAAEIVTTSNELDLLFSLMFDELLNGTTQVVFKSSVVNTADAPDKR
ncbi:retrovirus-related pol polyprotein from transposon TNT 1-94 [Tanacetum coccineum]